MKKSTGQIVRRYSTALFESALQAGAVAEIAPQAQLLVHALTRDVVEFFTNPRYNDAAKLELIESLVTGIKAHQVLAETLRLILANRRMPIVGEILENFLVRADEHQGITRADLVTAKSISSDEVKEFESALSGALKRKIILSQQVDESIKAGYIIKIGNTIVDASLRSRLVGLKESLSQGV